MGQSLTVDLRAVGKLTYHCAGLVSRVWEPDLCLLLKRYDSLSHLELGQEARLDHVSEQDGWGLSLLEIGPEPRGYDRVEALGELPRPNLSKPCSYVRGEGAIDDYPCHEVTGVAKPFKPRRSLTAALERHWVTGFHVDGYDVPRVVALRIPKPTMSVLHACLLHHFEEVDWRKLPEVLFAGDDARGVVFPENPLGQGFGIVWCEEAAGLY